MGLERKVRRSDPANKNKKVKAEEGARQAFCWSPCVPPSIIWQKGIPPARASGSVRVDGVEKLHTPALSSQKLPACSTLLKTDIIATLCARLLRF